MMSGMIIANEGYIDGSIEGINYVEVERETTCFSFGKT